MFRALVFGGMLNILLTTVRHVIAECDRNGTLFGPVQEAHCSRPRDAAFPPQRAGSSALDRRIGRLQAAHVAEKEWGRAVASAVLFMFHFPFHRED